MGSVAEGMCDVLRGHILEGMDLVGGQSFMDVTVYEKWMFRILLLLAFFSNIATGPSVTAIILGLVLMVVQYVRMGRLPAVDKKLGVVVFLYLFAWFVCSLESRQPLDSLRSVIGTAYRFLPLFFILLYVHTKKQVRYFVLVFAASVFMNDSWALFQVISQTWGYRPMGFVHNPNSLANHMLMAIPVLFFFSRKAYFSLLERRCLISVAAFSLGILLLTQTRGAWLAFIGVMVLYLIMEPRYRRNILFGSITGLFIVGSVFVFSPTYTQRVATLTDPQMQSNLERTYMWNAAVSMWKEHPIFGVGMDQYYWYYNVVYIPPEAKERPVDAEHPETGHGHPHNNILKHLAEGGILGLAVYLILHGYILFSLWQKYLKERGIVTFSCALMGILVFSGVHLEGLVDTNINPVSILTEYCLLMGLALRADAIEDKNGGRDGGE